MRTQVFHGRRLLAVIQKAASQDLGDAEHNMTVGYGFDAIAAQPPRAFEGLTGFALEEKVSLQPIRPRSFCLFFRSEDEGY
jgi:hypothetical protein